MELAEEGVRVTVVSPGFVRSELLDGAPEGPGTERLRALQAELGLEPEAVAEQVAHALAQPPHVLLREIVVSPAAQTS
jgi:NADP-dependent 3-hydroxy acid dehydrogenase YdfG